MLYVIVFVFERYTEEVEMMMKMAKRLWSRIVCLTMKVGRFLSHLLKRWTTLIWWKTEGNGGSRKNARKNHSGFVKNVKYRNRTRVNIYEFCPFLGTAEPGPNRRSKTNNYMCFIFTQEYDILDGNIFKRTSGFRWKAICYFCDSSSNRRSITRRTDANLIRPDELFIGQKQEVALLQHKELFC